MVRGILVFLILWLCVFGTYLAALRATPTSLWQVVKGGAVAAAVTIIVSAIMVAIVVVF